MTAAATPPATAWRFESRSQEVGAAGSVVRPFVASTVVAMNARLL
jgi:hypothetical protein